MTIYGIQSWKSLSSLSLVLRAFIISVPLSYGPNLHYTVNYDHSQGFFWLESAMELHL